MRRIPLLMLVTLAANAPLVAQSDSTQAAAIEAAQAAAEHWLAIVDSAGWKQSHGEASTLFQQAVSPETWIRQIRSVRMQTGPIVSRTLSGAQYATSLPNAPDGEYVVLSYLAQFATKVDAIETITPMKDTDGTWRVSGYYVK